MESSKKESCLTVQIVRGRPFLGCKFINKEGIEAALDFKPRDTDIFVNTFPKCGTNWMKYIVYTIITRGQKPLSSFNQLLYEAVPYVEFCSMTDVEALPDPRPLHYHFPYDLIPKNPKSKYIYLFRSPKDNVVSFYHFSKQIEERDFDFDDFFEAYLKGETPYGDYFDHVLSWYEHRNDPNVLFMSYEQLHADTRGCILKIGKFIGEHYYEDLASDRDYLESVFQQTQFKNMKKNLAGNATDIPDHLVRSDIIEAPPDAPGPRYDCQNLKFLRKGITGDWKNYLSEEQNQRMEKKIQEKFGGTEIIAMFNAAK